MKGRLWYPQLDVYDAVRRIGLLLFEWHEHSPVFERLYIADFYMANPPLLHNSSMPELVRNEFKELSLPRPKKMFLSYPAAPILFQKMEPIQKKALQTLVGRGIVDAEAARKGSAKLTELGRVFVNQELKVNVTNDEHDLLRFLTNKFAIIGDDSTKELRKCTGLRRLI